MPNSGDSRPGNRVLVCAPFGRDAELIQRELRAAGITAEVCESVEQLAVAIGEGAGAALIADEALRAETVNCLAAQLAVQPPWSDFPLVIMTSGGDTTQGSRYRLRLLAPLGNVSLLERPLRSATLISSIKAALRARRHQHQLREHLEELEAREQALRDSEERFRTLADNIPNLTWMADPAGHVFWYNQRWYEYTGTTLAQMEGWGWRSVHDPEVLPRVVERWRGSLAAEEPFEMVFPIRGADGVFRPFLTRVVPVRDRRGKVVRWFGTNTDISEQKRTEEQVRRANRDLEQFAFSASHDLQEPLRMVSIYSQMLKARYGGQLDSKADLFLGYLVTGAKRMAELVKDLLAYSQIVQEQPAVRVDTDANDVLRKALDNLDRVVRDSGAQIEVGPLPTLAIDEVHLLQLFQNLVGNALKYRGPDPPQIAVYSYHNGAGPVVCVQDNGIGIDPQYQEKVFGIFKRLHRAEQYEGTGIGLAICQRIVERYGGRIWVQSAGDGQGSTFFFTVGREAHG